MLVSGQTAIVLNPKSEARNPKQKRGKVNSSHPNTNAQNSLGLWISIFGFV